MQRREFLVASAATAAAAVSVAAGSSALLAADAPTDKQLIELRTYRFASPQKRQAFEQFFGEAAVPALGRAGVGPVGAFKLLAKDNAALKLTEDANDLYVLLPHKSAESLVTLERRLAADEAYQSAGRSVLAAAKSDPAYTRYETSLMLGFDAFPQVQAPTKSEARLLQLRIYESHNEERAKRKIHMFNEGGEIAVFKRVGMHPVFFGQALAGTTMPNLTYMLAFDDDAAMTSAWNAFRDNAEWKRLSGDESYKDTVSTITNLVLRPVAGSQI
jgi:hypothetical protein